VSWSGTVEKQLDCVPKARATAERVGLHGRRHPQAPVGAQEISHGGQQAHRHHGLVAGVDRKRPRAAGEGPQAASQASVWALANGEGAREREPSTTGARELGRAGNPHQRHAGMGGGGGRVRHCRTEAEREQLDTGLTPVLVVTRADGAEEVFPAAVTVCQAEG